MHKDLKMIDKLQMFRDMSEALIQFSEKWEVPPGQLLEGFNYYVCNKLKHNACISGSEPTISSLFEYVVYERLAEQALISTSQFKNESSIMIPKQIIYSGNRTIVIWNDNTKTIVKCAGDEKFDSYSGFIAALAKKIYGSTHKTKKMIDKVAKIDEKLPVEIKMIEPDPITAPENLVVPPDMEHNTSDWTNHLSEECVPVEETLKGEYPEIAPNYGKYKKLINDEDSDIKAIHEKETLNG